MNFTKVESQIEMLNTTVENIADKVSDLSSDPRHIILSNKELPELLKVSSRTIQKWRDEGKIGYSKIGREIFYRMSDILLMLDSNYFKQI